MKHNKYSSFEEIDQQLKILALKREINIENIKSNIYSSKNKIFKKNLIGNVTTAIQSSIVLFVIKKVYKIFRK